MPRPNLKTLVSLFRDGDVEERKRLIENSPDCRMKPQALLAVGLAMPEMRVQALDFMASGYALDGPFDYGARFGEATFRLGRELVETNGLGAGNAHLLCAGRGALNWADSLLKEGKQREAIAALDESIGWLRSRRDTQNLPMLLLKKAEAQMETLDADGAEATLRAMDEVSLPPFVQVTYRALRVRLRRMKGTGTELPEERPTNPSDALKEVLGIAGQDEHAIRQKLRDAMTAGQDWEQNLMNALGDILGQKSNRGR